MAGGEHAKHRERMRTRFLEHGLDNFADHEVLELLLFYAVPRGDVNPLALAGKCIGSGNTGFVSGRGNGRKNSGIFTFASADVSALSDIEDTGNDI